MARNTRSSALRSVAVAFLVCVFSVEAAFEKGHVHLPFTRVGKRPNLSNRDALDSPAAVSIGSKLRPYVVNVKVGTPPQDMYLSITTSTGLSWLQDARTGDCRPSQKYVYPDDDPYGTPTIVELPSLCQLGSYNKSSSSTYMDANQQWDSFYADIYPGYSVSGYNMTDTLVMGDLEFPDMPMGLVTTVTGTYSGVLGLGIGAATYTSDYGQQPRFLDRIVQDGHAVTRAFSIWLDDAEGKSGNLLFGAIDRAAYEGDLLRVLANNQYAYHDTFGVEVVGLDTATDSDSNFEALTAHDFPLGLTISPGEMFSFLPTATFNKIVTLAGATYNATNSLTTIACNAASTNNARFKFRLAGPDGPVLNFETADLIIPRDVYSIYESYLSRYPDDICLFGVQKSGDYYSSSYYNLGSSILRRTYLVFDLENEEVAAAPVKFKPTGGDQPSPTIVAFASSGAPIPSASLYCADSSCQDDSECAGGYCPPSYPTPTTGSDDPRVGGGGSTGSGSGSRPGDREFPARGEETYWRNIAIGVGAPFGAAALVAAIAITIIWGRVCRGDAFPAKKWDDEDGVDFVPPHGPVMSPAGTMGTKMQSSPVVLPPGTLPVIREEVPSSRAPQLPVVAKASPITPPEPLTPSNRDSIAVSAVSSEDGPPAEPAPGPVTTRSEVEAPRSPKGKEGDRAERREA